MEPSENKLLFKSEVFQIVACAIEVLNTLGHGIDEKPYENALVVEFRLRGIPFRQQPPFNVLYKGENIGLFIPDLIVFDAIVVDTKVIDRITDHERGLMLNYPSDHESPSRFDSEFQTSKTAMGENHSLIRVHSWLKICRLVFCFPASSHQQNPRNPRFMDCMVFLIFGLTFYAKIAVIPTRRWEISHADFLITKCRRDSTPTQTKPTAGSTSSWS
jgi:GxxExxY protein